MFDQTLLLLTNSDSATEKTNTKKIVSFITLGILSFIFYKLNKNLNIFHEDEGRNKRIAIVVVLMLISFGLSFGIISTKLFTIDESTMQLKHNYQWLSILTTTLFIQMIFAGCYMFYTNYENIINIPKLDILMYLLLGISCIVIYVINKIVNKTNDNYLLDLNNLSITYDIGILAIVSLIAIISLTR
jgi:hypothetical protein